MRRTAFIGAIFLTLAAAALLAQSSGIIGSGTLPATCTAGRNIYLKTGASAGFYICLATDTWTGPLAAGSGAPTSATYITQTADGTLSAEQALGAMASGILRSETTAGVVTVLTDSAGIAANLSDETGSGLVVFGTSATLTTPTISGAVTFPDDVRQTFNPGANAAGLNVGALAGDPGTPVNGDLWYDSTANELTAYINGSAVALGAGGGGGSALSAITAATAGNTIGSGNNHSQVWNWALTTNGVSAFTFGESAASTSGTSINQQIVTIATAAGSTAVPLYINNNSTGTPAQPGLLITDANANVASPTYFQYGRIGFGSVPNNTFLYHADTASAGATSQNLLSYQIDCCGTFVIDGVGGAMRLGTTSNSILDINQNGTPVIRFNTGALSFDFRLAGVRFTTDGDGALTLAGIGNGFDEDLTWNFDDGAGGTNTIQVSSSTGVTRLDFTSISLQPAGYNAADGSAGVTVASCTAFEQGLCTAGTEPLMTMDELIAEVLALRRELATLRAEVRR